MVVVFFDISETLASVWSETDGTLNFVVLPRVLAALAGLHNVRKGVLTDRSDGDRIGQALDQCGLGRFFVEPKLRISNMGDDPEAFAAVAAAAGVAPDECVFVGERADRRAAARIAGMRTAPHVALVTAAISGQPVFWARITVPAGRTLAELDALVCGLEAVPVHVKSEALVLVLAAQTALDELVRHGFVVERMAEVGDTSGHLVRDDRPITPGFSGTAEEVEEERARRAFAYLSGEAPGLMAAYESLGPGPGGVYVAAAAAARIDDVHIPNTGHGHGERLLPDPSLLTRPGQADDPSIAGFAAEPSAELVAAVQVAVTSAGIRRHVAWLAGGEAIGPDAPAIHSRHILHRDNSRSVTTLARHLRELGYTVRSHEFSYGDRRLANLEAEHTIDGSDGLVLVTAHLDSTAALGDFRDRHGRPRRYDPRIDPAPGADDDASGTAAVLVVAECLKSLVAAGKTPTRTVRFVLFNAEEQGMIGSKAYARAVAAAGTRIAAVLQMDMIGGIQAGASWRAEVHSGTTSGGAARPLSFVPDPDGRCWFRASAPTTPEQWAINLFYFCNYMHDFFTVLGFDEEFGNFQDRNLSGKGHGADPVHAYAFARKFQPVATMATAADGVSSRMNTGWVETPAGLRHSAVDSDVVFHEFVHGVTERLVGGLLDGEGLKTGAQSRALGEGWSDYFALSIQNFSRATEKVVISDWISGSRRGGAPILTTPTTPGSSATSARARTPRRTPSARSGARRSCSSHATSPARSASRAAMQSPGRRSSTGSS